MATHSAPADAHHDDHAHDHPHGWRRYMYSTNHKDIGTLYLIFAIVAGMIGMIFSVVIRMELQAPGDQVLAIPRYLESRARSVVRRRYLEARAPRVVRPPATSPRRAGCARSCCR